MTEAVTDHDFELTLKQCGIEGRVIERKTGPTMEHCYVKLAPGNPVKKVISKVGDLSFYLKMPSLTIVPDLTQGLLRFSYMRSERYYPPFEGVPEGYEDMMLPVVVGVDMIGTTVVKDVAQMPSAIISGCTGGGKSVLIHALICSLISKQSPVNLKLIIVDPKAGAEFGVYRDLPHHFNRNGVITDPMLLCDVLREVIKLSNQRYIDFAQRGVTNLKDWNSLVPEGKRRPYIVIIVDELADLMGEYRRSMEPLLQSLVQKSRASGVHMILATQRPSVKVITGDIKANCPTRIALRVNTVTDSRVTLDRGGAETLLGNGDMLYSNGAESERIQAPYLTREQITAVVERAVGGEYSV